jgi:putative membrane protein
MKLHRAPWKVVVVRVIANAIAVAITVLVVPGLKENTGNPVLGYLALGAVFGLINAFLKPAAQFVAMPFLLGSIGLVVILLDILVFFLLDELTPLLDATSAIWIVAGGVMLSVVSFVLDNVLGLTPPVVLDRRQEAPA